MHNECTAKGCKETDPAKFGKNRAKCNSCTAKYARNHPKEIPYKSLNNRVLALPVEGCEECRVEEVIL
jgi:hypothetical protein